MKVLKVSLLFVMVLALLLASCAPKATETPAEVVPTEKAPAEAPTEKPTEVPPPPTAVPPVEAPTLVLAMNIDDLVTLDPAVAGESTNQFIHANVYDTLLVFDPAKLDEPIGLLAESWEASPDAKEFTFKIKQGIIFSTGNPMTAKDVAFSWLRGKYMQQWMFGNLETVEAVDDYTVHVVLTTPAADFYAMVSHPGWGVTDSVKVTEMGGFAEEGALEKDQAKLWMDKNSVGTAPYMLTNWEPKSEVVLEANPNYRGEQPYFGKVIIKHVEDPTAALQMLQVGDVDIVPFLDLDLIDVAQADPNLNVVINQTLDTLYLAMTGNCATKVSPDTAALLCQKEVRQAVYYSIDFDGLISAVLNGYALHAPALLPVGMSPIDPSLAPGRDVQKAKDLLAAAGYPEGIEIDFTYNSNPQRDTVAAKLQSDMAEAGIVATLVPMEATVYLTQMRAQELPIGFGGWTPDYLDPTIWTDNYVCPDTAIAFRMWYDNPLACELGKAIKVEVNPVTRIEKTIELQMIWLEDMNFMNLYQPQAISAMSVDIMGFAYHPARWMNLALLSK